MSEGIDVKFISPAMFTSDCPTRKRRYDVTKVGGAYRCKMDRCIKCMSMVLRTGWKKTEHFYSSFESQISSFGQIVFNLFELNLFKMEAYILGHTV